MTHQKRWVNKHKKLGLCGKCSLPVVGKFTLCKTHLEGGRARCAKRTKLYPEKYLLSRAKTRAKERNTPLTITEKDIFIPEKCPILGIPLIRGIGGLCPNSPTLDEIIPRLGYIPENIQVISHKANTMKSNASFSELHMFADWIINNVPK